MSSCEQCRFKRTKFCGSRGNPAASLVFIGESPGAEEIKTGKPFVGISGQLIDEIIDGRLGEEDYYVVNAVNCIPAKSKLADRSKAFLREACLACHKRLIRDISNHPRTLIVAFGNGALHSILNDYTLRITNERGKLFKSSYATHGVLATTHPAFILRGGGSYQKFVDDINYAIQIFQEARFKEYREPDSYSLISTLSGVDQTIDEIISRCREGRDYEIGADIETTGLTFWKDRTLCLGISILGGKYTYIFEEQTLGYLRPLFNYRRLRWVWHNGKFDIKFLRKHGLAAYVDHDTMLQSWTLDETRGIHGLEQVGSDALGAPDYKYMLDDYLPNKKTSYEVIPKPVLYKYLAIDASNTIQIHNTLYNEVTTDENNNKLYHQVLIPASEFLTEVETGGIQVDLEYNQANHIRLENVLAGLEEKFGLACGRQINLRSPKQVGTILYDHLKLASFNKGTADEVLEKLPQHECVKILREYRTYDKQFSTYVKPLPYLVDSYGKVHSTYLLNGTRTGRLASRNPNLQNPPRVPEIRGQYTADSWPRLREELYKAFGVDEFCLIEIDYSQAELRVLAELSGDPTLISIYRNGDSLHKEIAIHLFGQQWWEIYKVEDKSNPEWLKAKEDYVITKALNFGIIYGITAFSIADDHGMSVREAREMLDGWADKFPVAWEFIQACRQAPVQRINLMTVFGNRKRSGFIGYENLHGAQNEAANFPPQATASYLTLTSAIETAPYLRYRGARTVNLIHDANLICAPRRRDITDEIIHQVTKTMRETPSKWGLKKVPFEAEADIGFRWGSLTADIDKYWSQT